MTLIVALSNHLKNPELFAQLVTSAGLDVDESSKRFAVIIHRPERVWPNRPIWERVTAAAIDTAYAAQEQWAGLTARARSDILWEWHRRILDHGDDLAAILTRRWASP